MDRRPYKAHGPTRDIGCHCRQATKFATTQDCPGKSSLWLWNARNRVPRLEQHNGRPLALVGPVGRLVDLAGAAGQLMTPGSRLGC